MGRAKTVQCVICKHRGHVLTKHIREEHGLSTAEYTAQHLGAEIVSEFGRTKLAERKAQRTPTTSPTSRKRKLFDVGAVFGIDTGYVVDEDSNGNKLLEPDGSPKYKRDKQGGLIPVVLQCVGFDIPGEETPVLDESYVFDKKRLISFLIGMECEDRILLTGQTGTGKTTMPQQVAARLNYNCVRIGFDKGISRDDLVGCFQFKPGEGTVFQDGILPHALKLPGTIIILDEWDTIGSECSFVLQRLLEKNDGHLQILEKGGELVPLHNHSTIVATANTIGLGDDSGLYSHGTSVQNYAQLNRFGVTIKFDYLDQESEKEILRKRFIEDDGSQILHESEIASFVSTINAARDGFSNGELSVPLSPRDLINWAEKYIAMGNHLDAAELCFLNRMPTDDAIVMQGLIQRAFGG